MNSGRKENGKMDSVSKILEILPGGREILQKRRGKEKLIREEGKIKRKDRRNGEIERKEYSHRSSKDNNTEIGEVSW